MSEKAGFPNYRLVIDTNVLLAYLISANRDVEKVLELVAGGKLTLVYTLEIIAELLQTASRRKFRTWFAEKDLGILVALIEEHGELVSIEKKITQIDIFRDPTDLIFLEAALNGKADFIVTGDKDLLELKKYQKTRIVTVTELMLIHRTP